MVRASFVCAVALVLACSGDDGGRDATSANTTQTSETNTGPGSSGGGSSGVPTSAGSSSGMATTMAADSSEGGSTGPACNPVIPGEYNACHDADGNVDNTQCNWMGLPDTVGFIGCLVSADDNTFNVCMISQCRDTCDCFAPPATGTAPVICEAILDTGDTACALSCENGETCPDGMECQGSICFHPPA